MNLKEEKAESYANNSDFRSIFKQYKFKLSIAELIELTDIKQKDENKFDEIKKYLDNKNIKRNFRIDQLEDLVERKITTGFYIDYEFLEKELDTILKEIGKRGDEFLKHFTADYLKKNGELMLQVFKMESISSNSYNISQIVSIIKETGKIELSGRIMDLCNEYCFRGVFVYWGLTGIQILIKELTNKKLLEKVINIYEKCTDLIGIELLSVGFSLSSIAEKIKDEEILETFLDIIQTYCDQNKVLGIKLITSIDNIAGKTKDKKEILEYLKVYKEIETSSIELINETIYDEEIAKLITTLVENIRDPEIIKKSFDIIKKEDESGYPFIITRKGTLTEIIRNNAETKDIALMKAGFEVIEKYPFPDRLITSIHINFSIKYNIQRKTKDPKELLGYFNIFLKTDSLFKKIEEKYKGYHIHIQESIIKSIIKLIENQKDSKDIQEIGNIYLEAEPLFKKIDRLSYGQEYYTKSDSLVSVIENTKDTKLVERTAELYQNQYEMYTTETREKIAESIKIISEKTKDPKIIEKTITLYEKGIDENDYEAWETARLIISITENQTSNYKIERMIDQLLKN